MPGNIYQSESVTTEEYCRPEKRILITVVFFALVFIAPTRSWSVAVTVPVTEIDAEMKKINLWKLLLQRLTTVIVVIAASAQLFREIRWSNRL